MRTRRATQKPSMSGRFTSQRMQSGFELADLVEPLAGARRELHRVAGVRQELTEQGRLPFVRLDDE